MMSEIELLAWSHRGDTPFIDASASNLSDAGGRDVRVEMVPRSFWDEDPRFLEIYPSPMRRQLRQIFDAASFCPTKKYVCVKTMHTLQFSRIGMVDYNVERIRGVDVAEALTSATRAEDFADVFAWIESIDPSHAAAQDDLQRIMPSRALNNEVAYMIFCCLQLEFDVRLTGLCSAAHLNGRQGVIRVIDSADDERWKARLDDGTWVSVKAVNFEHIRRGDYRRRSP